MIRDSDFDDFADMVGIYIEPPNTNSQVSSITFSQMTYDIVLETNLDILAVRCASVRDPERIFDDIIGSQIYQVIIVCK